MRTRKAIVPDAQQICDLVQQYSGDGTLLPRRYGEICENIRDFVVVEDKRRIIGCGALHLYGMHLAEVRSIAVAPHAQKRGAGRRLITALLKEARQHHIAQVCLFTRSPQYFARLGFVAVPHQSLPDKIFKDCHKCPLFNKCDETAMVYAGAVSQPAVDDEVVERPVLRLLS